MKIVFTEKSLPIPEEVFERIVDISLNGIEIMPKGQEDNVPMPWDADINIEGTDVVIEGAAGSNGFGYCKVKLPIRKAMSCIDVEIEPSNEDGDEVYELRQILNEYRWL